MFTPDIAEAFDEQYPDFNARDFLESAPRHIPEPFYREAVRRAYEARLYSWATGQDGLSYRELAQEGWRAIAQGREVQFARKIAGLLDPDKALRTDQTMLLYELFLYVSLRAAGSERQYEAWKATTDTLDNLKEHLFGQQILWYTAAGGDPREIGDILISELELEDQDFCAALEAAGVNLDKVEPEPCGDWEYRRMLQETMELLLHDLEDA